jgi:hypothetical protein
MRGRDATGGRYRGRHRKRRTPGRVRGGVRAGVMMVCAGLFVCLPQPSWADHADTVAAHHATHARATKTSRVRVQSRPGPFGTMAHR